MFFPDIPPEIPTQEVPAVIAESVTGSAETRVIGQCVLVSNPPGTSLIPVMAANIYFKWFEGKEIGVEGTVSLLEEPQQGDILSDDTGRWAYVPAENYQGMDSATFQVEVAGYKIKLVYGFNVMPYVGGGTEGYDPLQDPELCPNGQFWKVSPDGEAIPLKRRDLGAINSRGSKFDYFYHVELHAGNSARGTLGGSDDNTDTLDSEVSGYG